MIEALNLEKICKVVSNYSHDRMIGILFARYDTSKNLIEPNYSFWDSLTSEHFDIFLAGYGAYLSPDEQTSRKKTVSFSNSNEKNIFFDDDAYLSIIDKIESELKSFEYNDSVPLLVLLDTNKGVISWNKPLIIKLKDKSKDCDLSKELVYKVSELTKQNYYISDIWTKLKIYRIRKKITYSVSFSDMITLISILMDIAKTEKR